MTTKRSGHLQRMGEIRLAMEDANEAFWQNLFQNYQHLIK